MSRQRKIKGIKDVTRDDVRDLVDSKIFKRGVEYFAEGCVVNPTLSGNTIRAEVEGSSSNNYKTSVKVAGNELMCECDCPYDWGICKHVIALLLHWVKRRQDFEDIGRKAKAAKKMPREDLEKIVETLAKEEPQVFSRITELALPGKMKKESGTQDFVKQARRVLEYGADYQEMSSALRQLRAWRGRMLLRASTEEYDYVASQLCRLADACAENYGHFDDSNGTLADFTDECLGEAAKIWEKVGEKKKIEILLLVFARSEKDEYGFEDTFDDFIATVCKSRKEKDAIRRPILQKLSQLEDERGEIDEEGETNCHYKRIFDLALRLGFVNEKGVYIQG